MHVVKGELPLSLDRRFLLTSYLPGHAQLLFRSGRVEHGGGERREYSSVVDLLFMNVAAIAVAEDYPRLEVSLATNEELAAFTRFLNIDIDADARNLYSLNGGRLKGYVLAGAMCWFDDPAGSIEEESVLISDSDRARDIFVNRA